METLLTSVKGSRAYPGCEIPASQLFISCFGGACQQLKGILYIGHVGQCSSWTDLLDFPPWQVSLCQPMHLGHLVASRGGDVIVRSRRTWIYKENILLTKQPGRFR